MNGFHEWENEIKLMKPLKPRKKYKWYWNVLWGIGWVVTIGVVILCCYGLFKFGGMLYELLK